mmetsp:Transcript_15937/g.34712  ORF Transcript_15937/g.34712 Transcript_15937/m.34712 type:complete len:97 (+) Transcript_15937:1-291(+)
MIEISHMPCIYKFATPDNIICSAPMIEISHLQCSSLIFKIAQATIEQDRQIVRRISVSHQNSSFPPPSVPAASLPTMPADLPPPVLFLSPILLPTS